MAGRTTALTQKTHDTIVKYIRAGNYFDTACRAAGIHPATGHKWMRYGHPDFNPTTHNQTHPHEKAPKDLTKHRAFHKAVTHASAMAEATSAANWLANAREQKDWRGEAEFLARRHPERWGRQRLDIQHGGEVSVTGPVVDVLEQFSDVFDRLTDPTPPAPPTEAGDTDDEQPAE